ncbi:MAG: PilZ domain-containing protein [Pseudobutyrivibrio sp.]|nr:PilZ domain-containing protein [Pseudobutyrivibrio sp.]
MKLEQLKAGQDVVLEVLIGGSSFEIKSKVVGTNLGTGALINPYIYNGQVVDFAKSSPKSMSFSLHCIDPITDGRVVWKNVSVEVVNFRGKDYYAIDVKSFGSIAASSERRTDSRVDVVRPGTLTMGKNKEIHFNVSVLDISDSGISFVANKTALSVGDEVEIGFSDATKTAEFDLFLNVKIVRAEAMGSEILYAAKILKKDQQLLVYLCFKALEIKSKEKIEVE